MTASLLVWFQGLTVLYRFHLPLTPQEVMAMTMRAGIGASALFLLPSVLSALSMRIGAGASVTVEDEEDLIVVPPPLGSGTGNFAELDNAIDNSEFTGSIGQVAAKCNVTCLGIVSKSAEWRGFPRAVIPRLECSSFPSKDPVSLF